MRTPLMLQAAAVAVNLAWSGPAPAYEWPNRPLTMVVPFAAGGGADLLGRILAPPLSELLGQPVTIENVGGAGGMTGALRVSRAAPDGHQFVLGTKAVAGKIYPGYYTKNPSFLVPTSAYAPRQVQLAAKLLF